MLIKENLIQQSNYEARSSCEYNNNSTRVIPSCMGYGWGKNGDKHNLWQYMRKVAAAAALKKFYITEIEGPIYVQKLSAREVMPWIHAPMKASDNTSLKSNN